MSRNKGQYEMQMSKPVDTSRQMMIPLVERNLNEQSQLISEMTNRFSNPSKQQLHKLNDASYITSITKHSKLQQFCDSIDKRYKTLSPDSRFFLIWNIFLVVSILFNFFELPISIFLTEQVYEDQFSNPGWVVLNAFLLHVIFIDTFFVRPNLAFYENGELIVKRYPILKRYLKVEFYLDFVAFVALLIYISANYRNLVYFKLLFYLKFYSLAKVDSAIINYLQLHKIMHACYIFARIFIVLTFIVIWSGTVYFAIDFYYYNQQGEYYQNTMLWLTDTLGGVDFIQQLSWPYWFLYATYWSSQITSTIGYGVGIAKNPFSIAYESLIIVVMTLIFALFINTVWDLIAELQQSSVEYYQSWSSLNKILRQRQISKPLTKRVSQYFHQVWKYNDKTKDYQITENLSQTLQKQLLMLSHLHIFYDIPLMERWQHKWASVWFDFKMKVFQVVEKDELAENQVLMLSETDETFYCVLKGRIKLKIKDGEDTREYLYNADERFGYEEFFCQRPLSYIAQADCFTRICKISRSKFIACLKKFPILYFDFINEMELMKFTNDRSILGQKCQFCSGLHTPFSCPTKTRWRSLFIHKDPIQVSYLSKASSLQKSQIQGKKIYRNFVKSQKVYRKKLCSMIEIDRIADNKNKNEEVQFMGRNKFNF